MRQKYIFFLSLLILLHFSFSDAYGKRDKKISVLGKYDFYYYYTYEELTNYLQDINKAYPRLTELKPLCQSEMGRNVWMLIINNPETGKPEDKPGFFLNQIHASEVIASMSCCYTAWYLLENYGRRKELTQIVDNIVWYIVPRLDVDGAEAYLTQKPAGKDSDPTDDDGDFAWGSSIETTYDLFGIFSMGDEHWSIPDYNKDGKITEKERLRWNDEEMDGKIYIDWHPFNHPTLGEAEVGGWRRWKVSPPEGKLIQKECEMGNRFVIYLAGLAPKIRVGETKITDKKGGIYQIDITVENTGVLPTAIEQAQTLKAVKPVILEVDPD